MPYPLHHRTTMEVVRWCNQNGFIKLVYRICGFIKTVNPQSCQQSRYNQAERRSVASFIATQLNCQLEEM